jgi:hypothetical protein
VEEALAQLNRFANTNLAANGWTAVSGGFWKERPLGDGYYRVTVTYSNILTPTVTVAGHLPAPPTLAWAQDTMLAGAFVPNPNIKYITRTVQVRLRKEPALAKGMVAKQNIELGGNSCLVDSYDSTKGAYNAATAGDKGDVASNADLTDAVGVGNAKIKGRLMVGPKGTAKIGPNGVVGSVAWHAAGKKGLEPGWFRKDMNFSFPDVSAPWEGGAFTPTWNGSTLPLDDGNYEINGSLIVDGNKKIQVKGKAVLYVRGNINISGEIQIHQGGSLKLYCGGSQINLSGTYDKSDIPKEFMVYGLPSVKTVSVNGVALVLYAPSANLSLTGNAQYYGSSVTRSVSMNGTTAFHYDESLGGLDRYRQYVITSWNEI